MAPTPIRHVALNTPAGTQIRIGREHRVYSSALGDVIRLELVPEALTDPDAWIEYGTEVHLHDDEPAEPWQDAECEKLPGTARVFARGITDILTIYEED